MCIRDSDLPAEQAPFVTDVPPVNVDANSNLIDALPDSPSDSEAPAQDVPTTPAPKPLVLTPKQQTTPAEEKSPPVLQPVVKLGQPASSAGNVPVLRSLIPSDKVKTLPPLPQEGQVPAISQKHVVIASSVLFLGITALL